MESSTSATASKKRKISHEEEEEDDEDEHMEKFYALIKSIREARDQLIMNNGLSSAEIVNFKDQSETKKRKLEEEESEKQVVVWTPSFQREDFMKEADNKLKKLPPVSLGSASQSKRGGDIGNYNDRKEEVKEELDLSLSL